jgi:hypothetical protein
MSDLGYHGPRGRFTQHQRPQLRAATPQMSAGRTPAPPTRFQSQVNKHAEAQRTHERHVRYVALMAVSFVTVFAVLASFAWLSVNGVADKAVHAVTVEAGAR